MDRKEFERGFRRKDIIRLGYPECVAESYKYSDEQLDRMDYWDLVKNGLTRYSDLGR